MRGAECLFSHDLSSVPCKFFHVIAGGCSKGATCSFSHAPLSPRARAALAASLDSKAVAAAAAEVAATEAAAAVAVPEEIASLFDAPQG